MCPFPKLAFRTNITAKTRLKTAENITSAFILLVSSSLHLYSIQLQLYGLHSLHASTQSFKEVFGFSTFFWKLSISAAYLNLLPSLFPTTLYIVQDQIRVQFATNYFLSVSEPIPLASNSVAGLACALSRNRTSWRNPNTKSPHSSDEQNHHPITTSHTYPNHNCSSEIDNQASSIDATAYTNPPTSTELLAQTIMRLTVLLLLTTASAAVLGQSHRRHQHRHAEKRADTTVVATEIVTAYAYEYNGKLIPGSEVCDGIKEGRFEWQDVSDEGLTCLPPTVPTSSALTASPTAITPSTSSNVFEGAQITTSASSGTSSLYSVAITTPTTYTSSYIAPPSQTTYALPLSQESSSAATSSKASSSSTSSASYSSPSTPAQIQGLDKEFPSGTIDCSVFPSEYGAVPIPWLNVGGWSGIQYPPLGTDKMATAIGGMTCSKGAACSYACPPGYQKSQWPDDLQGGLGQSVGGLLCNDNNKLELTNAKLSEYLCIPGTGATLVNNQLKQNAAICRTDYPGD